MRGLGILGLNDSLLRPALIARTEVLQARVLLLDPDSDAAAKRAAESGESTSSFAAGIRLAIARLEALGYDSVMEFTKDCENYRFGDGGREFLATVVRVPEIDSTFLEVETMADEDQVDAALSSVRAVLEQLGVAASELTTELYTDAVRAARAG